MIVIENAARELLKQVIDPEIGLNIVDLGLIYDLTISENRAYVLLTLTTMGCPLAGPITDGIYKALEPMGLDDMKVDLTFDPPWTPDRMSPEGKKRLGIRN